jgi:hypothetical protein
MPPINNRRYNPSPEIEYSEINIPDDTNLGTGSFTTVLKPDSLIESKVICGMLINIPVFQISVNINPPTKEIPVLLGRADGTDPISKRVFRIPDYIDSTISHMFIARFENWQVMSLEMDEMTLS